VRVSSGGGPRHVVVIGGGISGLSAAHAIAQAAGDAVRITVLDKARVVGGHLRLAEVAGIVVDVGAESLLTRRPEAVDLARSVGLGEDLEHPAAVDVGLWSRGTLVPLPATTVLGVPSTPDGLAQVLDPDEVARVAAEPAVTGPPLADDVAVGRLVSDRLGPAVTQRLVDPFLGGIYACRADDLSLRGTMPDLAAALERHRSLLAATAAVRSAAADPSGPVFAGIRGGVGRLPFAVTAAAGAQIRTGTTVRRLHRLPAGWRVEAGPVPAPTVVDADAVIVAVPATPAARILRDVAPAAATELAAVGYASVAIVTIAVPASAFPRRPLWSGYLIPPVDGHLTKAVTFSSIKWSWLAEAARDLVVLRASIGRYGDEGDLQHEDGELIDRVLAELADAVGVVGRPVDANVTRWGGALPQYAVGHMERMARARSAVDALPGLAVCGAAYGGVGVAACVATARRAAARVLAGLGLVSGSEA
jgi:protoporphyrinogen/coproporphyrinogen III oxidase